MMTRIPRLGLLATIAALLPPLLLASGVAGQSRGLPSKADELVRIALETSPKVQLARSKVAQAEAELREVRLRVTQEVFTIHGDRMRLESRIRSMRSQLSQKEKLARSGHVSESDVITLRGEIDTAEIDLDSIQAHMRALIGMELSVGEDGGPWSGSRKTETQELAPPKPRRPTMPPELAALLAVDTSLETEEGSLMDVLELLRQTTGGKPSIVVDGETLLRELGPPDAILVTLSLGESTLHDTLAALADVTGIVFVARDYGLLATTASRAFELYGATIPADAPILSDVVRARDR